MEFLKKVTHFSVTRRKFFSAGAVTLASIAVLKKYWPLKARDPKKAKFLTRDGTLVEVPVAKLPKNKNAISKEGLISWVWRNNKI